MTLKHLIQSISWNKVILRDIFYLLFMKRRKYLGSQYLNIQKLSIQNDFQFEKVINMHI